MRDIVDVAIIGGGISGLYAAWRLQTAVSPPRTVHLYEMSQRAGGRLLSVAPPEMSGIQAELGGMRFLTNQPLVSRLIAHLELPAAPFPVSGPENIYFVRGQHLRHRDFANPDQVPYRLSWRERGKTPGQLIAEAIDMIVPGAAQLNADQWQHVKETYRFNGRFLYEQGFWNLLHQVLSSEAYEFIMDAGGYDTTLTNWNAAEAIPWYLADFGQDAVYMKLTDGYERLPQTIAARFAAAGGQLHLGRRLRDFSRGADAAGAPLLSLRFADGETIQARHLILAMPRRSLELLDPDGDTPFFSHPTLRRLLPTVTPHPMFKLFLCYRYPWWQDAGVDVGRSVTDLPLRQVYYFGSETAGPAPQHAEMRDSLVMASYDDGRFVGFWTGLADPEDIAALPPTGTPWDAYQAPQGMITHAQRQLRQVHDLPYIPEPYAAAFMDWGQDPFGGAWNSWNIHVKAWEVRQQMIQPLPDWPVYVCGEAYSAAQGWVEGALQTAEAVLGKLGLAPPDYS
ncbi:MAG: FAD-dependent oxidoreductase [Anaerolineales bacterium]|nr:FAD-dependent oxidoreductase [Anaerolineales bacterium]